MLNYDTIFLNILLLIIYTFILKKIKFTELHFYRLIWHWRNRQMLAGERE